jgi:cytochrome b pre-mRNA-processing protein 3
MRWPFSRDSSLPSGAALYAAIVSEARRPDWYLAAGVPDTIDGRFSVLATLLALTDVRLGQGGPAALQLAPRLAECFIADMDAQMREEGFGDPSLGKQVRMMVGSLASRVDRFGGVVGRREPWPEAVAAGLYRGEAPAEGAAEGETLVRNWWARLKASSDDDLVEGVIA